MKEGRIGLPDHFRWSAVRRPGATSAVFDWLPFAVETISTASSRCQFPKICDHGLFLSHLLVGSAGFACLMSDLCRKSAGKHESEDSLRCWRRTGRSPSVAVTML